MWQFNPGLGGSGDGRRGGAQEALGKQQRGSGKFAGPNQHGENSLLLERKSLLGLYREFAGK
jgi:hypothetical protein